MDGGNSQRSKHSIHSILTTLKESSLYTRYLSEIVLCLCAASLYRTIGKAWQSLKAELRHRSEAHSKFAEKVK